MHRMVTVCTGTCNRLLSNRRTNAGFEWRPRSNPLSSHAFDLVSSRPHRRRRNRPPGGRAGGLDGEPRRLVPARGLERGAPGRGTFCCFASLPPSRVKSTRSPDASSQWASPTPRRSPMPTPIYFCSRAFRPNTNFSATSGFWRTDGCRRSPPAREAGGQAGALRPSGAGHPSPHRGPVRRLDSRGLLVALVAHLPVRLRAVSAQGADARRVAGVVRAGRRTGPCAVTASFPIATSLPQHNFGSVTIHILAFIATANRLSNPKKLTDAETLILCLSGPKISGMSCDGSRRH